MSFLSKTGKFRLYTTEFDFENFNPSSRVFNYIDETSEESSVGFVCFDDYMQPVGFTPIGKGSYLAVTLRVDTRKVPGAVFKKYMRTAIEEEMKRTNKEMVSRERRKELKEIVKLSLLKKTLPVPMLTDVIIDPSSNMMIVCNGQKKVNEYLMGIMEDMGCPIRPVSVQSILKNDDDESGEKFLNWLFWKANTGDYVDPGKSVSLCSDNGSISVVDQGLNFNEAKSAIAGGKGVIKAAFMMKVGEDDVDFSIDESFCLGIKTPKMVMLEDGDEPDKLFYDKFYFVQKVIAEIEKLVNIFSSDLTRWGSVAEDINEWGKSEN